MYFNSISFLIFFASVLTASRLISSWRGRKICLLFFSYVFYAAWSPPFVLLLFASTIVDWYLAGRMEGETRDWARRLYLWISVTLNLGVLAVFKYTNFLVGNFASLGWMIGTSFEPEAFSITLPVGISFYTFQSLSYTIDVYRRKIAPWRSFVDFALYVSFFPQLVAGPIVRADEFLPQCEEPKKGSRDQLGWGCMLMALGLFGKMFLADTVFAPLVEPIYDSKHSVGTANAWIATLAFSGQIFFDFWGYSVCAVGAALAFGFSLPMNFHAPYAAVGLSDFWRRWHISLSSWMRDYLYIPLGGARAGSLRTDFNLFLTMLLVGLWHGASWMFVIWGGLHGAYLVCERWIKRSPLASLSFWSGWWGRLPLSALTYILVCLAWVFFRAPDLPRAILILQSLAGYGGEPPHMLLPKYSPELIWIFIGAMLAAHLFMRDRRLGDLAARIPWWIHAVGLALLFTGIFVSLGAEDRAFIYFQF